MSDTKIIITTLVKDEGWMLERFLSTASIIADHIIVSDESTGLDNSIKIYEKYPKVILHRYPFPSSDHSTPQKRRKFVFEEARKIVCKKRIIIALDSDEILSANIINSNEWNTVLNSEPGTLVHLQWVTLWKSHQTYRVENDSLMYGNYNRHIWIDDGISEIPDIGHGAFHMAYNPLKVKYNLFLNQIVCLHYQFCNWARTESKHRYYRVQEKIYVKKLSDLAIYRIYGWMYSKNTKIKNSKKEWFEGWEKKGIDISSIENHKINYFDLSVIEKFDKYGTDKFKYQDIWNIDWNELITFSKNNNLLSKNIIFTNPKKKLMIRLYHAYMRITIDIKIIRLIERIIFRKKFEY